MRLRKIVPPNSRHQDRVDKRESRPWRSRSERQLCPAERRSHYIWPVQAERVRRSRAADAGAPPISPVVYRGMPIAGSYTGAANPKTQAA